MKDFKFNKDFSLDGKVALITGAGRGIGKAIAIFYAKKGAHLILVGRSNNVKETEKEVKKLKSDCLSLIYDIKEPENIDSIIKKSIDKFGRIDILVNNAGVVFLEDAETASKENWDNTIAVNLTAPFLLSQAVGKEMIKRKKGKIINIASLASVLGFDKRSAYCSSKAGLIGLTRALAFEWSKYNINVNAISPTVTLTEMAKKAWAGKPGEEMKKKIPMGRFVYPDEVAAMAAFLGSDASEMITGANIVIDGGYSIN
jgi:NAD(P)-dependent dehydrogenase (short-subunit alcohol dehydrogenase family)